MSEDQFTHLFKYMQKRFNKIDAELKSKATIDQVNRIYDVLDGITERLDVHESELTALASKVERLEQKIA